MHLTHLLLPFTILTPFSQALACIEGESLFNTPSRGRIFIGARCAHPGTGGNPPNSDAWSCPEAAGATLTRQDSYVTLTAKKEDVTVLVLCGNGSAFYSCRAGYSMKAVNSAMREVVKEVLV
jgi:hypothetical protein